MMRKRTKSPLDLQRHFKKRWWLRYPEIEMPELNWINAQIRGATEHARFMWAESKLRKHWQIQVEGRWIPVVYDTKRGTVVTCLPRNQYRSSIADA